MSLPEGKAKFLLFPLALFYWGVVFWRNLFYTIGFFVIRRVPALTISVGNLSVGGTGKTPAVIYIARLLSSKKLKVVIVSRGYRRKSSGTLVVSDGRKIKAGWKMSGDEPFLIARKLFGVPIVVDENRYRGSLYAVEKFSADIILLDDAFQHRSLERDIDIVLLNSNDPPEAYKLIPYGKLREPWFHLRRADIIFWSKTNLVEPDPNIRRKVLQSNVPAYFSKMENHNQLVSMNGKEIPTRTVKGKKAFIFCGVGDPISFKRSVENTGVKIVGFKIFEDHHNYNKEELKEILLLSDKNGADYLITTEKDIVKINNWISTDAALFSLEINFIPSKEGNRALIQLIEGLLEKKKLYSPTEPL